MKIAKVIGVVLLGLVALVVVGVTASAVSHLAQLRKEEDEYPPPGTMVEVDGQNLHVYTHGAGETTLVFMAGHGTCSPTLDFKPLWNRMVDDYRIAVVEKSGYGWSESSGNPRDLDTMLDETRRALKLAGEEGPYVLVAHSMSGLEAIYWGQKHPDEVVAIIGLDPLTPGAVETLPDVSRVQLCLAHLMSRTGLSRLMSDVDAEAILPLLKSPDLTEEDRRQYMAMFYRSAVTSPMLAEVGLLRRNADTVGLRPPADIPMYFFISEGQEREAPGWTDALTGYLSKVHVGKHLSLSTGHYVHHESADVIAKESKAFLQGVR